MNESDINPKKLRIAIIGAGMAGILAAIRLHREQKHEVVVYEKADRIGGTWRDNVYPGLTCDVPAHAYTYEFAPNPEWSAYLSGGEEILAYFEKTVDNFNIRSLINFNSEIIRLEWKQNTWEIELRDGRLDKSNVIIAATGVLHHPKIPKINGLESFSGRVMHTARWDNSFNLDGKRIGIIGNGSTGIQMVSALGAAGHQIVHFQRTPQWIMHYPNSVYSDADIANFRQSREAIDAVRYEQSYLDNVRRFTTAIVNPHSEEMHQIEAYCLANLEQSITDPILREKLRPNYRAACKRLIFSPNYYLIAQRPNVKTIFCGINTVLSQAIHDSENQLHALDIIALATGFHTDRFVRPISIKGLNDKDIESSWQERCAAYYAISIPDFPNLFLLNGPSSPVGNFSLIDVVERQWNYVSHLLDHLMATRAVGLCASHRAMEDYEKRRIEAAKSSIFGSGCSSWYLDKTGVPFTWPWDYAAFDAAMKKPDLLAYDLIRG